MQLTHSVASVRIFVGMILFGELPVSLANLVILKQLKSQKSTQKPQKIILHFKKLPSLPFLSLHRLHSA